MDIEIWHIWIIAAVILFIAEIFYPIFLPACIAIGCIFAGIVSACDLDIKIQLVAFAVGSLIAFFGIRPFMLKFFHKKSDKVKTNADALIGKIGRVAEAINNDQNTGRIIVEGDNWRAVAEDNEIVNVGGKVQVLKVDSTILIVKPIN